MVQKKAHIPKDASVVGPYSPAVEVGNFIYFSGQIPIDFTTGKIVEGGISEQTVQCFKNLLKLLSDVDITTDNIIKTTVYLTDMGDFATVNEIYAKYFNPPYPARTAIAISALPLGAKVEIEVIAQR